MNSASAVDAPEPLSGGSELCVACGLCCKGVLHDHAPLQPQEKEVAARLRLPIYRGRIDYDAFSLPCPHHQNDRCSVYPDRPKVCGDYQCDLLKRYREGTISLDEALDVVKRATGLRTRIHDYMGAADPSKRIWDEIAEFSAQKAQETGPENFHGTHAAFLVDAGHLLAICGRHFEPWRREATTS